MRGEEYLLSDEQIRAFITDGYVQVQTDLDDSVHRTIFEKTDRVLGPGDDGTPGGGSNPQNNILPMVGELAQVLEAPEVVGALTSVLGDGYVMLPHRHCHTNMPVAPLPDGRRGITMVPHRDGQAGCHKPRHRLPRWAIVFYYPQECPDRQGPTALIPGSHLRPRLTTELNLEMPLAVDRGADGEYRLPANYLQRRMTSLACGLGAVSIMHFDLGHSVLTNIADNMRYGHKFVFMRTEEPARPSWANRDPYWRSGATTERAGGNEIAWTYVWNWMAGAGDLFRLAPGEAAATQSGAIAALQRLLRSASEADRLQAANALGLARAAAAPAVADLIAALEDDSPRVQLNACYALGAVGAAAVDPLIAVLHSYEELYHSYPPYGIGHAAHALGAIGAPAVPALARALSSPHAHVRANAAYGLGRDGAPRGGRTGRAGGRPRRLRGGGAPPPAVRHQPGRPAAGAGACDACRRPAAGIQRRAPAARHPGHHAGARPAGRCGTGAGGRAERRRSVRGRIRERPAVPHRNAAGAGRRGRPPATPALVSRRPAPRTGAGAGQAAQTGQEQGRRPALTARLKYSRRDRSWIDTRCT